MWSLVESVQLLTYVSFNTLKDWLDIYSQGEFPGRVWGCRYQLWVASSCLWFLERLSANRWTHPVCWQNPARANTQHTGTSTRSNTANVMVLMWCVMHHNTTNRTSEKESVLIRFDKLIKVSEWGFAFVTRYLRECHTVAALHESLWLFQWEQVQCARCVNTAICWTNENLYRLRLLIPELPLKEQLTEKSKQSPNFPDSNPIWLFPSIYSIKRRFT